MQILAEPGTVAIVVAHQPCQFLQVVVGNILRIVPVPFERRTVQKSDLELRFGIAAGLRRLKFLLREVVDLIEILFADPVRILVPAGKLIGPVDKRPDRLAGVARQPEASFPGFIGDIGQRLGIVA